MAVFRQRPQRGRKEEHVKAQQQKLENLTYDDV